MAIWLKAYLLHRYHVLCPHAWTNSISEFCNVATVRHPARELQGWYLQFTSMFYLTLCFFLYYNYLFANDTKCLKSWSIHTSEYVRSFMVVNLYMWVFGNYLMITLLGALITISSLNINPLIRIKALLHWCLVIYINKISTKAYQTLESLPPSNLKTISIRSVSHHINLYSTTLIHQYIII